MTRHDSPLQLCPGLDGQGCNVWINTDCIALCRRCNGKRKRKARDRAARTDAGRCGEQLQ